MIDLVVRVVGFQPSQAPSQRLRCDTSPIWRFGPVVLWRSSSGRRLPVLPARSGATPNHHSQLVPRSTDKTWTQPPLDRLCSRSGPGNHPNLGGFGDISWTQPERRGGLTTPKSRLPILGLWSCTSGALKQKTAVRRAICAKTRRYWSGTEQEACRAVTAVWTVDR